MDRKNKISIQLRPREPSNSLISEGKQYETIQSLEDFSVSRYPWDKEKLYERKRSSNIWTNTESKHKETRNRFLHSKNSSRIFLVAGTAIAVGLLLGMLILSIFSNLEENVPTGGEQITSIMDRIKGEDKSKGPQGNNQKVESLTDDPPHLVPTGQVKNGVVQLPARAFYVIQAGAFSSESDAKSILQEHIDKGWAGLLLENMATYRFYIGITTSKDHAQLLGSFYQGQGLEIYVKEHVTAEVKEAKVAVEEKILQLLPGFLSKGDQLIGLLGEVSANGLIEQGYELTATDWNEIQELHRAFLQEGSQLSSGWKGEEKRAFEQMLHSLTQGVNALEMYKKKKHLSYLWQVQQDNLRYLQHYEQFISLIK